MNQSKRMRKESPKDMSENDTIGTNHRKNMMYHKLEWRQVTETKVREYKRLDNIVILAGNNKNIDSIVNLFVEYSGKVYVVVHNHKYSVTEDGYTLTGSFPEYKRVFTELKNKKIEKIVYVGTFGQNDTMKDIEQLKNSQDEGLYFMLMIEKIISEIQLSGVDFWVLSDYINVIDVSQNRIIPEKSTLVGILEVIRLEDNKNKYHILDVDDIVVSKNEIIKEISAQKNEFNITFRNGYKYTQVLSEVDFSYTCSQNISAVNGGVYIITGGLGNMGIELATYLGSKAHVHIVLLSRRKLPEEYLWDSIIVANNDLELCETLLKLTKIKKSGSTLMVVPVDIADQSAMIQVLDEVREKYGRINGVIHAAGIGVGLQGKPAVNEDRNTYEYVCKPKVDGTLILHNLTLQDELDYMVVFTSAITLIGGKGSGSYVAANLFLDYFVSYRNRAGQMTIGLSWAPWEKSVGENFNLDASLFIPLSTKNILDSFQELVNHAVSSVVIVGKLNPQNILLKTGKFLPFKLDLSEFKVNT